MHHMTDENGAPANPLTNASFTRVSVGLVVAMAVVSFMGMLPRFMPYFVLTISSFMLPFPKPWVLITGTFYCSSIFSGALSVFLLLMVGRTVEPIIGSREFLRMHVMIGFYTNILTLIFAVVMYFITSEPLVLVRPFETGNAPSSALMMLMAYLLIDVKMPTACGTLKMRLMPFMMFCVSLFFSLLSAADSLLSTVFGIVLSYIYIRYIRRARGVRGDPSFTIDKLLPACSMTDENESSDGGDDGRGPTMVRGMDGMMPNDEHHNFRLDTEAPARGHGHGQQHRPQTQFQGRARTIGD